MIIVTRSRIKLQGLVLMPTITRQITAKMIITCATVSWSPIGFTNWCSELHEWEQSVQPDEKNLPMSYWSSSVETSVGMRQLTTSMCLSSTPASVLTLSARALKEVSALSWRAFCLEDLRIVTFTLSAGI